MNKIWCILAIVFLCACQKENPNKEAAARLASLYSQTLTNISYPYHNSLKADYLLKQLVGIPASVPVERRYEAAYELLKAGRNEDCIATVLPILEGEKVNFSNSKYFRILANAYLRLGEQNNCFHQKGTNACTLPFTAETIHKNKVGSENAVDIYEQLLAYNPRDIESKWLYNIAMSTLGKQNDIKKEFKIQFTDNGSSEVKFQNILTNIEMGHAGGASMDDFDNDGDLDLFMSSYHLDENVKFLVNQNGKFKDRTTKAALEGITGGLNFIHGDVNNDGFLDILILRGGWLASYGQFPPSLLINNQDGTFIDATDTWKLSLRQPTQTAVFSDINLDGKLDLIMGAEATQGMEIPVRTFLNTGSSFSEITKHSGIEFTGYVKGLCSADINNDGHQDLYISVLGGDNKMYLNTGQEQPSFTDVSDIYKIAKPWASFVCWFFDFNNDGFEDLYVGGYNIDDKVKMISETAKDFLGDTTNFSHPKLYKNINGEQFLDVTEEYQLNKELYAMGGNFADVNNDGYLDLYLGTGEFNMWAVMPNRLFVNNKGIEFDDQSFSSGLAMIQKGHGIAFGDFDGDGDQDIFHTIGGAVEGDIFMNYLYQNNSKERNWITLKLEGKSSNSAAIGARVKLFITEGKEKRMISRTVSTGGSFGNNSLQLEIGINTANVIDSILVSWPTKKQNMCKFYSVAANEKYTVLEQDCDFKINKI